MSFFRARLSWLAAFALTFQVGVTVAASTALCCGHDEPGAATQTEMACCKDGGKPHVCPMPKKVPPPDPAAPLLKSCCDVDEQLFAALFGAVGILRTTQAAVAAPAMSLATVTTAEQPIALVLPPEAPPPRA